MGCGRCGANLSGARSVAIEFDFMGNEHSDRYTQCPKCRAWTVNASFEGFLTDTWQERAWTAADDRTAAFVALIERCPTPFDKRCNCEAHRRASSGG